MDQLARLESVSATIRKQVLAVLEQYLETCKLEKRKSLFQALVDAGWSPEDISDADLEASILAEVLEGIYATEGIFEKKMEDLGYDA